MPRKASVEAIRSLVQSMEEAEWEGRTMAEVTAALSISTATFYRVLRSEPELAHAVRAALLPQSPAGQEPDDDPIEQHPRETIAQLKEMVLRLLLVCEQLRDRLDQAERVIRRQGDSPIDIRRKAKAAHAQHGAPTP